MHRNICNTICFQKKIKFYMSLHGESQVSQKKKKLEYILKTTVFSFSEHEDA